MPDEKPLTAYQQAIQRSNVPLTQDSILEGLAPERRERLLDYLHSIDHLKFGVVTANQWQSIRFEGLDEEKAMWRSKDWQSAELPVTKEDACALRSKSEDAIEMFNVFDILLKHRHSGNIIDMIDYDMGVVRLVRPTPKPQPSPGGSLSPA